MGFWDLGLDMSQTFKCPWCKGEIQKARYPDVQSFLCEFEIGTTSDIFGPSLTGYGIENMCTSCALKLKNELEKLGIKIQEFDI